MKKNVFCANFRFCDIKVFISNFVLFFRSVSAGWKKADADND